MLTGKALLWCICPAVALGTAHHYRKPIRHHTAPVRQWVARNIAPEIAHPAEPITIVKRDDCLPGVGGGFGLGAGPDQPALYAPGKPGRGWGDTQILPVLVPVHGGGGGGPGSSGGGGGGPTPPDKPPVGPPVVVPPGVPGVPGTPGAVPEPATWLSMIAGLAVVGMAQRVRRRRTA